MDLQLTGKIVVVTGAASGIGQATARLLTEEGAVVVGVDRDRIDTTPGAHGTTVQADLTDPATPDRVIATVVEQHGRIDALVNNVGGLQARTSFLDITDEQWLGHLQPQLPRRPPHEPCRHTGHARHRWRQPRASRQRLRPAPRSR